MESELKRCPFFKSTPGCIPEAFCVFSGLSRTQLKDGSFAKPEGCEYPDITNNNCEVLDVQNILPPGKILIGGRKKLVFNESKK